MMNSCGARFAFFLLSAIGFNQAFGEVRLERLEFHVSAEKLSLEKSSTLFTFENSAGSRSIPVMQCNSQTVESIWGIFQTKVKVFLRRNPQKVMPKQGLWIRNGKNYYPVFSTERSRLQISAIEQLVNGLFVQSFRQCQWTAQSIQNLFSFNRENKDHPRKPAQVGATSERDFAEFTKSCVEEICPHPQYSSAFYWDAIYERAKTSSYEYTTEIEPLVHQLAVLNGAPSSMTEQDLQHFLDHPINLSNPSVVVLFNFFQVSHFIGHALTKMRNGKLVIDEELSRSLFPELTDLNFRQTLLSANQLLETLTQKALLPATPEEARVLLGDHDKFLSEINSAVKSLEDLWSKLIGRAALKNFFEIFGVHYLEDFKLQMQNELKNEDSIVLSQVNDLFYLFKALEKLSDENSMLRTQLTEIPIDLPKFFEKSNLRDFLSMRRKRYQSFLNNELQLPSTTCRVAFEKAIYSLPTEKDKKIFRGVLEGLKLRVSGWIAANFEKKSATLLEGVVNQWNANYSQTYEEFKLDLIRTLKAKIDWLTKHPEDHQWLKLPSRDDDFAISASATNDANEALEFESENICRSFLNRSFVLDEALPWKKTFLAGAVSMKTPEYALGIVEHEMGHLIEYEMLANPMIAEREVPHLTKIRRCLFKTHKETDSSDLAGTGSGFGPIDFRYAREDFADLVSAIIAPDLENHMCFENKKTKISDYGTLIFNGIDDPDPHSPELWRLLHIHYLQKGRLPPACGQAARIKNFVPAYRNCWLEGEESSSN